MPTEQVVTMLRAAPPQRAVTVLLSTPERVRPQLDRAGPEHLAMLLDVMPAPQRRRLTAVLDPRRLADLRRVGFEKAVLSALGRTAAGLRRLPDDPGSHLLAGVFQRLFGVALCYVDEGPLRSGAVVRARQVFAAQQVEGLLIVTNAIPDGPAAGLVSCDPQGDLKALVATWESGDNGGVLGRALVRLAG
jgi:hypothetical protein